MYREVKTFLPFLFCMNIMKTMIGLLKFRNSNWFKNVQPSQ